MWVEGDLAEYNIFLGQGRTFFPSFATVYQGVENMHFALINLQRVFISWCPLFQGLQRNSVHSAPQGVVVIVCLACSFILCSVISLVFFSYFVPLFDCLLVCPPFGCYIVCSVIVRSVISLFHSFTIHSCFVLLLNGLSIHGCAVLYTPFG